MEIDRDWLADVLNVMMAWKYSLHFEKKTH
jgi:hypothetical protein